MSCGYNYDHACYLCAPHHCLGSLFLVQASSGVVQLVTET